MTTNGKGSVEKPSLRMQSNREELNKRANHQNCIPSNRPVRDGEEQTLARQV